MQLFVSCFSCARYTRRTEAKCAFCGAARAAEVPLAPSPGPRLSRSQWVAVGSALVTMGCSSQGGTPQNGQTALDNETLEASTPCGTDASGAAIAPSDASDEASAEREAGTG